MTEPAFTVVVPAFNAEATVGAAIRSVLLQSRQDFEIVVVDDGSTDETRDAVRAFTDSRVRLIQQANVGPGAARNAGVHAGTAPLLSLLDSDDLWLPGYLERMGEVLAREPDAGFAYTDAWVIDDRQRVRRTTAMAYQRPLQETMIDPRRMTLLLAERNFVFTAATIRRAVFDEVGGFDERLWNGEDRHLWLRIASAGYRAARVPEVLAIRRHRTDSLTGDAARALQNGMLFFEVVCSEHPDRAVREIAARERTVWERRLHAIEQPTPTEWLLTRAKRVRSSWRARSLWLDEPPATVAETLRAVAG